MSADGPLRALAFDHYGTLFDKGAIAQVLERHVPGRGHDFALFWFRTMQRYCFQNGMMERYQSWDELTDSALTFSARWFDVELDDDAREALIEADLHLPPFPDVPAALERLSARFDLYVLSMASQSMLDATQKRAGTARFFERIISGDSRRVYKPSKSAYQLGVDTIGLPRDAIGFVSSNSFDVVGSANFGLTTFWVNRRDEPLDVLGPEPDWSGPDLLALADELGA
jgi:2-haloacid dehalogenase